MEDECKWCGGDGIERCDNPDHGLLSAISFRGANESACPCCGHDDQYRMGRHKRNGNGLLRWVWNKCPYCQPTHSLDAPTTTTKKGG